MQARPLVADQLTQMMVFFFQAEDGIRDGHVTGVQTCALPIYLRRTVSRVQGCQDTQRQRRDANGEQILPAPKIGRASCRGKSVGLRRRLSLKKKWNVSSGSVSP